MNLIKNVKVKVKLIVSFLIVAVLIGIVGGVGTMSLKNVGENAKKMYDQNLRMVYILTDSKQNLTQIRSDLSDLINGQKEQDSSIRTKLEKSIKDNKEENDKYLSEITSMPMSDEEKKIYEEFSNDLKQHRALRENIIKLVDENNYESAQQQYKDIPKVTDAMFESLNKLIDMNLDESKQADDNIVSIYERATTTMTTLSIAGLILAIAIGWILEVDITRPLQTIKLFGEKLAAYDLSHDFKVSRKDEFGQTGDALFKAQDNIKELVKTIIENSQNMSASSEELSATVEELSSKALNVDEAVNNIASHMQEASAGTEEISASIHSFL